MEKEGGLVVRGRVEIDMRQPFTSVKEAISLFGEKVLAAQIYANKLQEIKDSTEGAKQSRFVRAKTEVEETKQSNEKTKEEEEEEGNMMAYYLNSLKQELEQTKKELHKLKSSREKPLLIDPEIEQLKFIEDSNELVEVKTQSEDININDDHQFEFQNKRSVKFASPPLLTKVFVSEEEGEEEEGDNSSSSLEKKIKRKKTLIPFIGALFLKKKGGQENPSSKGKA